MTVLCSLTTQSWPPGGRQSLYTSLSSILQEPDTQGDQWHRESEEETEGQEEKQEEPSTVRKVEEGEEEEQQ